MKIGFIGAGKMGGAILKGIITSNFCNPCNIFVAENNQELAEELKNSLKINIGSMQEVIKNTDVIIICTKPFVIKDVLSSIKDIITPDKLIISIAAGISTATIQSILNNIPVIRVMPNTPALLQEGISALTKGTFATEEHLQLALEIFSKVGKAIVVKEELMDAVTGVSGSGPAFYYLVIEALAKGGEELGLSKEIALELSAQTAIGAAKMILETNKTPETLRKEVTTPGGTTEQGLIVLDNNNIVQTLIDTVHATAKKSKELGA